MTFEYNYFFLDISPKFETVEFSKLQLSLFTAVDVKETCTLSLETTKYFAAVDL
jgi:hypothetical protein